MRRVFLVYSGRNNLLDLLRKKYPNPFCSFYPTTAKPKEGYDFDRLCILLCPKSIQHLHDDAQAKSDRLEETKKKYELTSLLRIVLKYSTAMPFKWHSNKYLCFFCGCPFVESALLRDHTRTEHQHVRLTNVLRYLIGHSTIKLDIDNFECTKCGSPVKNLDEYLEHISRVHNKSYDKQSSRNLFEFKLSDDRMNCLECGQSFRFFGPLLSHVYKYHNKTKKYICEICGKCFVAKTNVASHVKNVHAHIGPPNECRQCNKSFATYYLYNMHNERIHKTEKLKCPKCPEILGSKYLKKKHLALVHDVKGAQFQCEKCSKIFLLRSKLVGHVQRVHLKEKTIACDICGFKVFSKDLLKSHMIKHDDSRPYQCKYCKKSFQRKKTLEFHTRIHTNDKRYVCKDCGKAFVQVTSLKLHMRVHHSGGNEGV